MQKIINDFRGANLRNRDKNGIQDRRDVNTQIIIGILQKPED
jgi:hypothetical protein